MTFHNFIHLTKKTHRLITTALIFFFIIGSGTYHAEEATDAKQPETYEKLKIFTEVLYLIETNYVEEDVDVISIIESGIHEMMRTIDPEGSYMPPDEYYEAQVQSHGQFGSIGVQIVIKDKKLTIIDPIEGEPAYYAGIQPGDRILKIDGTSTKNMSLMEAVKLLRGPIGSNITVTIMRDSFKKPRDFSLIRETIEIRNVIFKMLNNNIGYIRFSQFQEYTPDKIEDALNELEQQGMKALILDLRGNSGGLLIACIEVADKFLVKGKLITYTEGRKKNQDMRFLAHQDSTHPNYPMVVLVNHASASGAEIVAGALQAHQRALILGIPTYGRITVQSVIPLSDNSGLRLTTAKFYTPLDEPDIQDKGIIPDIIMEQPESETLIKFGDLNSDAQLQRAFNILTFQMVY